MGGGGGGKGRGVATTCTIKHIRAKPSALSQNPSQLLARMRRCVRVILSTRAQLTSYSRPSPAPKALGVVASSKGFTMFTSIHVSDVILITSSEIVG